MTIAYQQENLARARPEAEPLIVRHYREVAHYQDIPLEVNWPAYEELERLGRLYIYTARVADKLVGYACYFVNYNMHYASSLQAIQDVLYVAPEHRNASVGYRLIKFADDCLKVLGVQVVYQHSKVAKDFGAMLERIGYEGIDLIYGRRLDAATKAKLRALLEPE